MGNKTSKLRRKYDGGYGNEILYRMCERKPKHEDINIISSKIWIIGRAYAAAIERGVKKEFRTGLKSGEDFHQKIAAPAIKKAKIDKWIKPVLNIRRVTEKNLNQSLECHKKLVSLFKEKITGKENRSLASKYLHFHAPNAFFIYDSRAKKRIGEEIEKLIKKLPLKKRPRFTYPKGYDNEYSAFCARCIFYRDFLKKQRHKEISPRLLDMKLLKYKF